MEYCLAINRHLGVGLSGIDFKLEIATGKYFVQEANSMPGFQGYDVRSGGRIMDLVHRALT